MSPELISPSDPRYFSQTSDDPYDRHQYKLFYTSGKEQVVDCLLYTSPSPRDKRQSRMPSSA